LVSLKAEHLVELTDVLTVVQLAERLAVQMAENWAPQMVASWAAMWVDQKVVTLDQRKAAW
jgi:hypothetical protein